MFDSAFQMYSFLFISKDCSLLCMFCIDRYRVKVLLDRSFRVMEEDTEDSESGEAAEDDSADSEDKTDQEEE